MNIMEIKEHEVLRVDIHKYNSNEAKYLLERLIVNLNPEIKEVVVIHGWRRGNVLMDMVRNDLMNKKITRKLISLNPGVTSLVIDSGKH